MSSVILPLVRSPAHRGKDLVPVEDPVFSGEDLLQMFQFEQRRYSEHAVSTKTAVGAEHMQMRMPSKEIAKRMYCHNGPRNGPLFRYGFPEKFFQGFPVPPSAGLRSESNFRS